jgi:ribosome-associated translation inhibitor RaiA
MTLRKILGELIGEDQVTGKRGTPEYTRKYVVELNNYLREKLRAKIPEAEAKIQALINDIFEQLKKELREHKEKFPDADYHDISGYIVGFQNRPEITKRFKGK